MHNQHTAIAIILTRTDYGEADRILTLLTPTYGKIRLIAKGVRRVRSKLAGGIELFSVSTITFVQGRGEIGTLISARLTQHYGRIVTDLARVQTGYECIRLLHKNTEDQSEEAYFSLLKQTFVALDDPSIDVACTRMWFQARLLRLGGFVPDLHSDARGDRLAVGSMYVLNPSEMALTLSDHGPFGADHIKVLRLVFGDYAPAVLARLNIPLDIRVPCCALVHAMFSTWLRI